MKINEGGLTISIVVIWALTVLINLGLLGAVIYIVAHFVCKFW